MKPFEAWFCVLFGGPASVVVFMFSVFAYRHPEFRWRMMENDQPVKFFFVCALILASFAVRGALSLWRNRHAR